MRRQVITIQRQAPLADGPADAAMVARACGCSEGKYITLCLLGDEIDTELARRTDRVGGCRSN